MKEILDDRDWKYLNFIIYLFIKYEEIQFAS